MSTYIVVLSLIALYYYYLRFHNYDWKAVCVNNLKQQLDLNIDVDIDLICDEEVIDFHMFVIPWFILCCGLFLLLLVFPKFNSQRKQILYWSINFFINALCIMTLLIVWFLHVTSDSGLIPDEISCMLGNDDNIKYCEFTLANTLRVTYTIIFVIYVVYTITCALHVYNLTELKKQDKTTSVLL